MVHEAWTDDWGGICWLAVNDPPHAAQKNIFEVKQKRK